MKQTVIRPHASEYEKGISPYYMEIWCLRGSFFVVKV